MRLADQIDENAFARKDTELRDRVASIKLQLEVLDRSHDETADLALNAFELSQALWNQWFTADSSTKRRILEIICFNCRLDSKNLVSSIRKPFDVLVEGSLLKESGVDRTAVGQFSRAVCEIDPEVRTLIGLAHHSLCGVPPIAKVHRD